MQKRLKRGYHGESILNYFIKTTTDDGNNRTEDNSHYTTQFPKSPGKTPRRNEPAKHSSELPTNERDKNHSALRFRTRTDSKCPGYKWISDTPFTVDAFRYGEIPGCQAYFLSHFHSDHYGGLTRDFTGPIYCSQVTCGLLKQNFQSRLNVTALELNRPMLVCGIEVVAMDANHCPGSVMFLFHLVARRYFVLHTGDFRFSVDMLTPPSPLAQFVSCESDGCTTRPRLHSLYLDTTYCAPQYNFVPQHQVIAGAVRVTREWLAKDPSTVVVCGMYSIGKERFIYGLASELNLTVWLPQTQSRLVRVAAKHGCTVCQAVLERTTTNFQKAQLHVLSLNQINMGHLIQYSNQLGPTKLQTPFTATEHKQPRTLVAWRPTGWSHISKGSNKVTADRTHTSAPDNADGIFLEKSNGNVHIYGAAYSEHSSFPELKKFVTALQPKHVQPTVFGGAARSSRESIDQWLESKSER